MLLQWLVVTALLSLVSRDEAAIRAGHVGYHFARDFGGFGRDGAGLSAGYGSATVVGVAAGGDEEREMEQSECCC